MLYSMLTHPIYVNNVCNLFWTGWRKLRFKWCHVLLCLLESHKFKYYWTFKNNQTLAKKFQPLCENIDGWFWTLGLKKKARSICIGNFKFDSEVMNKVWQQKFLEKRVVGKQQQEREGSKLEMNFCATVDTK